MSFQDQSNTVCISQLACRFLSRLLKSVEFNNAGKVWASYKGSIGGGELGLAFNLRFPKKYHPLVCLRLIVNRRFPG